MTDLTVLSSSPLHLYPLVSASRSSFFNNYVPSASSSQVHLVTPVVPKKSERPARLDVAKARRKEADKAEDGRREQSPDEEEEEIESPDSYVGPQTAGWNRSGHNWQLDPASSSISPNLAPTHLSRGRTKLQQHRPARSRSAPPIQTTFSEPLSKPFTAAPDATTFDLHRLRRYTSGSTYTSGTESGSSSPSNSFSSPPSYGYGYGKSKGGDLLRPPPPLHRPTTFWRRTPRSGVTASSYSPSSHLIRRSTFVAAGLPFESPMADISALGVESRIKAQFNEDNARAKVSEVFWEVVVQR
ncbi:hypothetical protein EV368DRAFT_80683 [Lentinula lateritia]|uniref:Uncharacterized protein n=1 Tax=Lentinula aff. lateritia TaxID=2804960 RepID=A0ACC1U0B5_9AGAR|nr:hypothetical protein F5876DRAFT_76861 [Lentinula aff. lateritia]KAJ3854337.1 hypothetical protein EV368DRAFT_80683 [Lentinula lateritia]